MSDQDEFQLSSGKTKGAGHRPAAEPTDTAAIPLPPPETAPNIPPPLSGSTDAPLGADVKASDGARLAEVLLASNGALNEEERTAIHPVILFGDAFSGKTSLLLSLFAALETAPRLSAGLELDDSLFDGLGSYSNYIAREAKQLFYNKKQNFIDGKPSGRTNVPLPFFIPVTLRLESGRRSMRFAFMESNGEWYRVNRDAGETGQLFPGLKQQIEAFLQTYSDGIIFIHIAPYTQSMTYSADEGPISDQQKIDDASLALSGAMRAYEKVRPVQSRRKDQHIMLVTKWDQYSQTRKQDDAGIADLLPSYDKVTDFLARRYRQAFSTYSNLRLENEQRDIQGYCSGIMGPNGVVSYRQETEDAEYLLSHPANLWRWLYKKGLTIESLPTAEPFPGYDPPRGLWAALQRLLDRIFR